MPWDGVNGCHRAANPKVITAGILKKQVLLDQRAVKKKIMAGS